MSVFRMTLIELLCDEPGCEMTDSTSGGCRTLPEERAELARRGWSLHKGKDYCPAHTQTEEP